MYTTDPAIRRLQSNGVGALVQYVAAALAEQKTLRVEGRRFGNAGRVKKRCAALDLDKGIGRARQSRKQTPERPVAEKGALFHRLRRGKNFPRRARAFVNCDQHRALSAGQSVAF